MSRIDNIVPACRTCNTHKGEMTGEEYGMTLAYRDTLAELSELEAFCL